MPLNARGTKKIPQRTNIGVSFHNRNLLLALWDTSLRYQSDINSPDRRIRLADGPYRRILAGECPNGLFLAHHSSGSFADSGKSEWAVACLQDRGVVPTGLAVEDLGKDQQQFCPVRGIFRQPKASLECLALAVQQFQIPDTVKKRDFVGGGTLERPGVRECPRGAASQGQCAMLKSPSLSPRETVPRNQLLVRCTSPTLPPGRGNKGAAAAKPGHICW